MSDNHQSSRADNRLLSEKLGFDVGAVELQIRFRLDLMRMQQGLPAELGYALVDSEEKPHAAVVFGSPEEAKNYFSEHPAIQKLRRSGHTSVTVRDTTMLTDIASRAIILP